MGWHMQLLVGFQCAEWFCCSLNSFRNQLGTCHNIIGIFGAEHVAAVGLAAQGRLGFFNTRGQHEDKDNMKPRTTRRRGQRDGEENVMARTTWWRGQRDGEEYVKARTTWWRGQRGGEDNVKARTSWRRGQRKGRDNVRRGQRESGVQFHLDTSWTYKIMEYLVSNAPQPLA